MININIYALFYPDVSMIKCTGLTTAFSVINFIVAMLVLLHFFLSRKRLALPILLFQFCQSIYFMSLTNSLKDDCLANVLASLDSFGFMRLASYFIGPLTTAYTGSFLTYYVLYDYLLYNLVDILFIGAVLCAIYVILANAYIFMITLRFFEGSVRRRVKTMLSQFSYAIPLKFIELAYYPACFFLMNALFNSAAVSGGDIAALIITALVIIGYLFFSNTILTTYFGLYLRTGFLKRFGSLYAHLNFVNLRTIGRMVRQGGPDDYMLYRYVNMTRGHLTLCKIFAFFKAVLIVYTQNTDGLGTYTVLMIIEIVHSVLFLFLKVKNGTFYYAPYIDHFQIWLHIITFLNCLILLVSSQNSSSVQFASIFLITVDVAFYLVILAGLVYEGWADQSGDILWKIRNSKREKNDKKNEFVKLLQAEVVDSDGRTADRKVVRRAVANRTADGS